MNTRRQTESLFPSRNVLLLNPNTNQAMTNIETNKLDMMFIVAHVRVTCCGNGAFVTTGIV